MTQPAGWYDDPQDASQFRYWDGVLWSSHVSPKVSPALQQSNIGKPPDVSPAYGQGPRRQQPGSVSPPSTTPDGVLLAGWGTRVGARVLDSLFTFVLALPLTGWFFYRYFLGVMDWSRGITDQAAAGSTQISILPPWGALQFALYASLVGLLVSGTYEVLFLRHSGATPGKKIVGISVRLRERSGPPPLKSALGRTATQLAFSLVSFGTVLDDLWPLWDDKKQALHDKVAGTNVVVGPQPRRGA